MNNNIDIKVIRKNLGETAKLFDPNKPTYQMINECANNENITAQEISEKLSAIAATKEYPLELRNYFYKTMEDLNYLAKQDQEIENLQNEIIKENEELMKEMQKRNVHYYEPLDFKDNYQNLSYNEKAEYIEKLKLDLDNLKNKNYALNNNEKKLGEEFPKEITEQMKSKDLKESQIDEKMETINEEAKQIISVSNPDLETFKQNYNYMKDNQNDKSKLNIEITYKDDGNIEVNLGYKGTEVNEKYQMISYNFTDMEYFNKNILPFLVNEHIEEGVKNKEQSKEKVESENSYDESLLIQGNEKTVENVSHAIDENMNYYLDNKNQMNLNKPKVRVRELENNNGTVEATIYILVGILVILIIITVLIITYK